MRLKLAPQLGISVTCGVSWFSWSDSTNSHPAVWQNFPVTNPFPRYAFSINVISFLCLGFPWTVLLRVTLSRRSWTQSAGHPYQFCVISCSTSFLQSFIPLAFQPVKHSPPVYILSAYENRCSKLDLPWIFPAFTYYSRSSDHEVYCLKDTLLIVRTTHRYVEKTWVLLWRPERVQMQAFTISVWMPFTLKVQSTSHLETKLFNVFICVERIEGTDFRCSHSS